MTSSEFCEMRTVEARLFLVEGVVEVSGSSSRESSDCVGGVEGVVSILFSSSEYMTSAGCDRGDWLVCEVDIDSFRAVGTERRRVIGSDGMGSKGCECWVSGIDRVGRFMLEDILNRCDAGRAGTSVGSCAVSILRNVECVWFLEIDLE